MTWLDRRENWKAQSEDAREAGDIDYARIMPESFIRPLSVAYKGRPKF